MNRRSFMQVMAGVGAVTGFRVPLANAANYHGKLFVFVQASGGWDPTSLCDPKTNVAGEPIINNWAAAGEVRQAGNIRYAPFAKNQAFFDKYYQRILVVNGVDAQTNSHSAGVTHNWSGRISEGYPTTTALLAAHKGAGLSMPYLSFGGFSNTAGVAVFTRLNNPGEVRNIAKPELLGGDPNRTPFFSSDDWASVTRHRDKRMARLAAAPNLMPRDARNRELYAAALDADAAEGLRAFADIIPGNADLKPVEEYDAVSEFSQAASAANSAGLQGGRRGQRGPALGQLRHARQSRPGPGLVAGKSHGLGRLPVGLCRTARSGGSHGGGDGVGFRPDQQVQLRLWGRITGRSAASSSWRRTRAGRTA